MAKPIAFKPITVDFKADLQRRLEKAPEEHAAALLAAYDVLEAAHDQGLLDILHGLIASKDTIITTLSRYASQPEGIAGIRNLLTTAKILTQLDPEVLDHVSEPWPAQPQNINESRLLRVCGRYTSAPTAKTAVGGSLS